eukprot:TRINITY_DN23443_c0_g1_i1.p1 TRINITY_DN23443_c0_g1~~TRINITY_DN23443_c0_g1_i1.p1  ORF type:complete len:136 (+),score=5.60 TRINITY_DN23443_c0_g1_i1:1266-1673(+)
MPCLVLSEGSIGCDMHGPLLAFLEEVVSSALSTPVRSTSINLPILGGQFYRLPVLPNMLKKRKCISDAFPSPPICHQQRFCIASLVLGGVHSMRSRCYADGDSFVRIKAWLSTARAFQGVVRAGWSAPCMRSVYK